MTLTCLWRQAGRQPNVFTTNTQYVGALTGQDRRTAERHLKKLHDAGRIHIQEWDTDSGAVTLFVWRPTHTKPQPTPDPQKRLAFERAARPRGGTGDPWTKFANLSKDVQACSNLGKTVQPPHRKKTAPRTQKPLPRKRIALRRPNPRTPWTKFADLSKAHEHESIEGRAI